VGYGLLLALFALCSVATYAVFYRVLRGIGAGQTIDQVKLYGSAAKWFVEVGNHEWSPERERWFRTLASRAAKPPPAGPVAPKIPIRMFPALCGYAARPLGPRSLLGGIPASRRSLWERIVYVRFSAWDSNRGASCSSPE